LDLPILSEMCAQVKSTAGHRASAAGQNNPAPPLLRNLRYSWYNIGRGSVDGSAPPKPSRAGDIDTGRSGAKLEHLDMHNVGQVQPTTICPRATTK